MRVKHLLPGAAMLLLAGGCQDYFFDYTQGMTVKATSMTMAVYNTTPTDVLFVIDNSGTMSEEQAELIKNTEKFISAMVDSPNEFHIGVVTTDTTHYLGGFANDRDNCCMHVTCSTRADCNDKTKLQNPDEKALCIEGTCRSICTTDEDCMPGESCGIELTDDITHETHMYCQVDIPCDPINIETNFCDNGALRTPDGAVFKDSGLSYMTYPKDKSAASKKKLIEDFQNTVKSLGVKGTTFEAGLQAMVNALKSDKNNGFLRDEADLAIIFLTDENDCSMEDDTGYKIMTQDNCYDNMAVTRLRPVSEYLQDLVAIKGDISKIRAAGIIGSMPWSVKDKEIRQRPPLGYYASGCYQQGTNGASNDCCCLSGVQTTSSPTTDLYCQLLKEEPYLQETCTLANPRIPALNGADLGGCSAMPGSRYLEFLELLSANREAEGNNSDTLVDSICAAGYQNTLLNIVNSVILNDCFGLKKRPSGAPEDSLLVTLNGKTLTYSADGSVKGWRYMPKTNQICLTGGLKKNLNDEFNITIITGNTTN